MAKPGRPAGQRAPLDERIGKLTIVDSVTGCWVWQGAKNNLGYSLMRDTTNMKMRTGHRMSYEFFNNTTIPPDMCVCHSCDNPSCVNPNHLWLGTRKQNSADMESKGRQMYWGYKSMIGIPRPKKTCKYCGVTAGDNMIARNHNDKCKHKPI
jgi:hypothetical protein